MHDGSPFGSTVVLYMINREKHRLGFAAAFADVSAICCINRFLDLTLKFSGFLRFSRSYPSRFFWSRFRKLSVAQSFAVTLDFVSVSSPPIAHPLPNLLSILLPVLFFTSPSGEFSFVQFAVPSSFPPRTLARCFHVIILHGFHRIHTVICSRDYSRVRLKLISSAFRVIMSIVRRVLAILTTPIQTKVIITVNDVAALPTV